MTPKDRKQLAEIRKRADDANEFHYFNDYTGELPALACDMAMRLIQDRKALIDWLDQIEEAKEG